MLSPNKNLVYLKDSKKENVFLCLYHSNYDTDISIETTNANDKIVIEKSSIELYDIVENLYCSSLKLCAEKKKFCSFNKKTKTINLFSNVIYNENILENSFLSVQRIDNRKEGCKYQLQINNSNKVIFYSQLYSRDEELFYNLIYEFYNNLFTYYSSKNMVLEKIKTKF